MTASPPPDWLIRPRDPCVKAAAELRRTGFAVIMVDACDDVLDLPPALPGERTGAGGSARADGFQLRRRMARMIAGRLLDRPPADLAIISGRDGAPAFLDPKTGLDLSFSTRGDASLIGLALRPIGVDIELPIDAAAIPWNMLRADEAGELMHNEPDERAGAFVRLWSLKEAIAKAMHTGFMIAPEALRIEEALRVQKALRAREGSLFEHNLSGPWRRVQAEWRQCALPLRSGTEATVSVALLSGAPP